MFAGDASALDGSPSDTGYRLEMMLVLWVGTVRPVISCSFASQHKRTTIKTRFYYMLQGDEREAGCQVLVPARDPLELVPATGRTKEKAMNAATTFVQSPNHPSTSETHHTSSSEVQEANHHVRNMIILGLAMEVAFLATLAAYELSSIFQYQN